MVASFATCVAVNGRLAEEIAPVPARTSPGHQSLDQSLNQSLNQSFNQSFNQSLNQSFNPLAKPSNQSEHWLQHQPELKHVWSDKERVTPYKTLGSRLLQTRTVGITLLGRSFLSLVYAGDAEVMEGISIGAVRVI